MRVVVILFAFQGLFAQEQPPANPQPQPPDNTPRQITAPVCSIPLVTAVPSADNYRMPIYGTPAPFKGDVVNLPAPPCATPSTQLQGYRNIVPVRPFPQTKLPTVPSPQFAPLPKSPAR